MIRNPGVFINRGLSINSKGFLCGDLPQARGFGRGKIQYIKIFTLSKKTVSRGGCSSNWEVLNGVGVDGVGVIFPFFNAIFPFYLRIFPLFFAFLCFSWRTRANNSNLLQKNGEFHSDPVCTDPVQNFPI